jgi:type II secretory pathway pseudopilin PulG
MEKKIRFKIKNNGFSLLELLIYIAILSVVTLVITGIFISVNQSRGRTEAVSEVNSNLRFAIEKISQDLRFSDSISIPAIANSTSTSLTMNVGTSTIVYCISGIYLKRQINGVCSDLSDNVTSGAVSVTSLIFKRIENTNVVLAKTIVSIGVDLVINYNSTSPDWQYSGEKKITISLK